MDNKSKEIIEQEITTYAEIQKAGDYYASIGDYESAQKCYEKATTLNPDQAQPYVGLGIIDYQKNQLENAEIAFRVACRLDGECGRAYCGLAMIAQKKGDYEKAFEMYLKCLEVNTDNLTALLGLFQTSCQMRSFAKVIHYLELYLNMHPDDCSVMFALAALYVKEENFAESKKILVKILQLDCKNEDAVNLLEEVERNLITK
jgi:tetratricopeptide (TPR) repeat protein